MFSKDQLSSIYEAALRTEPAQFDREQATAKVPQRSGDTDDSALLTTATMAAAAIILGANL